MGQTEIEVKVGVQISPFGMGAIKAEAPVKFKGPEEVEQGLLMAEGIIDQTDAKPGNNRIELDVLELARKGNVKLPANVAAALAMVRPMVTLDVVP